MSESQTFFPPSAKDKPLYDLWLSPLILGVITVSIELGLFDEVEKTHPSIAELSNALQIPEIGCKAVVNVLVCLNFLEYSNGKLQNTLTAKTYFLRDGQFYWGDNLLQCGNLMHGDYKNFEHSLLYNKLKDKGSDKEIFQKKLDSETRHAFIKQMHTQIFPSVIFNVNLECFKRSQKVLDAGGGSGAFCIAFSDKYPDKEIGMLELPAICKIAEKYINNYKKRNIKIIAGDFFADDFPKSYDTFFFSNIFHIWAEDIQLSLAKKVYNALPQGGQIVIQEMLLKEGKANELTITLFNLLMYLHNNSRLFTEKERVELLHKAGFIDAKCVPGFGYYSVITARKP